MLLTVWSRVVTKMGWGRMFLQEYKALLWFASPLLPSNSWQTLHRKKTSVKDPASPPLSSPVLKLQQPQERQRWQFWHFQAQIQFYFMCLMLKNFWSIIKYPKIKPKQYAGNLAFSWRHLLLSVPKALSWHCCCSARVSLQKHPRMMRVLHWQPGNMMQRGMCPLIFILTTKD